jgi:cysteine desulfurase
VFTSGGTEADVLGIVGAARAARAAGRPARVIASPIEHPAARGAVESLGAAGFEIVWLAVDADGRLEPARGEAALVVAALANHELGNVYDVAAIGRAAREAGALVFSDAVQAVGKMPVDRGAIGADLIAISAHKFCGPKGAGALIVRRGVDLHPLLPGHQERGRRGGTENVVAIAGFGEAARIARAEARESLARVASMRDRLEGGLLAIAGSRRFGAEPRVPNTTNVAFEGAPGDVLVSALDLEGVACSTGAACTSGSVEPSRVILSLGVPRARAAEAVRFSLGSSTTDEEIDLVLTTIPQVVQRVRAALR